MGSRLSVDKAYIAGFLDGDGSLMLQIKKLNTVRGYRFMATICLYQDSRHDETLYWIRNILGIGYISKRSDSITELRINGFTTILNILIELRPFIRFKKIQSEAMIKACRILRNGNRSKLSGKKLLELVNLVLAIQNANYATRRKKNREELLKTLGLTP